MPAPAFVELFPPLPPPAVEASVSVEGFELLGPQPPSQAAAAARIAQFMNRMPVYLQWCDAFWRWPLARQGCLYRKSPPSHSRESRMVLNQRKDVTGQRSLHAPRRGGIPPSRSRRSPIPISGASGRRVSKAKLEILKPLLDYWQTLSHS